MGHAWGINPSPRGGTPAAIPSRRRHQQQQQSRGRRRHLRRNRAKLARACARCSCVARERTCPAIRADARVSAQRRAGQWAVPANMGASAAARACRRDHTLFLERASSSTALNCTRTISARAAASARARRSPPQTSVALAQKCNELAGSAVDGWKAVGLAGLGWEGREVAKMTWEWRLVRVVPGRVAAGTGSACRIMRALVLPRSTGYLGEVIR